MTSLSRLMDQLLVAINEYNRKRRQTFEERICDDLSEVILQFLSLEDRFRLECVSKQFQRTVYKGQVMIGLPYYFYPHNEEIQFKSNIANHSEEDYYKEISRRLQYTYHKRSKSFSCNNNQFIINKFELLLKKCPNIKMIYFDGEFEDQEEFCDQIIQLIVKYCNNLSHLLIEYSMFNAINFDIFAQKFGRSLKFVDIMYDNRSLKETKLCSDYCKCLPNIETFYITCLSVNWFEWKLKNLKSLELNVYDGEEELANNLILNFESLRHLIIKCKLTTLSSVPRSIYPIIKDLSKLDLIDLRIISWNDTKQISVLFKQLSNDCPNLKSVEFNLSFLVEDESQNESNIFTIKTIQAIKAFKIRFRFL